jgi:hypothetical protein
MNLGFGLERRWSWKHKLVHIAGIFLGEFLDSLPTFGLCEFYVGKHD